MRIIESINEKLTTSPRKMSFNLKEPITDNIVKRATSDFNLEFFNLAVDGDNDNIIITVDDKADKIKKEQVRDIDQAISQTISTIKNEEIKLKEETKAAIEDLAETLRIDIK